MGAFEAVITWLQTLPSVALLAAMAALAAIENIFPPIPADVLVAFGGFLAARTLQPAWHSFLAVWLGNVAGAMVMFALGRRYGSAAVASRFGFTRGSGADQRVLAMHRKYGTMAFFLSRFVPGVRSVVPPIAGALGIPMPRAIVAIAAASGLWYGAITWLAFRAGGNWDQLQRVIGQAGRWT